MLTNAGSVLRVIFIFLFGAPNSTLSAFFLFSGIAIIISYFVHTRDSVKNQLVHVGMYIVLIIIARHIDIILINKIVPQDGSTQMIVIMLMSTRVLREIFTYVEYGGIKIPNILTLSVDKLEEVDDKFTDRGDRERRWNEEELEQKIKSVTDKLKDLERIEKNLVETLGANRGGEKD